MSEIVQESFQKAYKPFDIVTNKEGAVGFIQEVNVNDCQGCFEHQINYSVNWLVGHDKSAWFYHSELKLHCNLFVEISKCCCHPFSNNRENVQELFNNINN